MKTVALCLYHLVMCLTHTSIAIERLAHVEGDQRSTMKALELANASKQKLVNAAEEQLGGFESWSG